MSRTAQLLKNLRKEPLFQAQIPMEAGIGWPIPLLKEQNLLLQFIIFGQGRSQEPQKVDLFPPFARAIVDWNTGQLSELDVDLRSQNLAPHLNWKDVTGTFPHPDVAPLGRKGYLEKRQQLLAMYDQMLDALAQGKSQSSAWEEQFRQLLHILIEPPLLPFYRAIAPKFIARFVE